jgi:hypothetical protein
MKTLTMKLKMKTNKNLYFFILLPLFLVLGCFLFKKTEATIVTPDFQGVGSGIWTDGTYQFIYDGSKLSQIKTDPIPFYYQVENYPPSRTLIIEPGYKIIKQTEPSGSTPGEVLFREDGNTYYPAYNVSTGGGVGQPQTGCSGGLSQYITCVPNTGWEKDVCPHDVALSGSSSADPHYCQGSVSFELKFKEYRPEVTVFGKDVIRDIDRQTVQMTVPYPTEGQNNTEIYWETDDVTKCECTSIVKGDCTPLSGTTYSTFIGQSIKAKDSPFSLTSDKTFSVECW